MAYERAMTKRNVLSTFSPPPVWPVRHGEYGARYQSATYLKTYMPRARCHFRPERTMEKKWRAFFWPPSCRKFTP